MLRYFTVLSKYFSNSNIVRTNTFLLGNAEHKWGKFPVHYVDEIYYYYYLKKIDVIVNKEADVEEKMINLDNEFTKMIKVRYFDCLLSTLRKKEMFSIKDMYSSQCFIFKTYHGTIVCYDAEYNRLIHELIPKLFHFPLYAIEEGNTLFLYFIMRERVFYIKNVTTHGEVEICSCPAKLNVLYNSKKNVSIQMGGDFLSARLDGEFDWISWNREWERFSLDDC